MARILQQHLLDHICHLCYRGINSSAVDSLEFGVQVVECADNVIGKVRLKSGSIEDCVALKPRLYSKGVKEQFAAISNYLLIIYRGCIPHNYNTSTERNACISHVHKPTVAISRPPLEFIAARGHGEGVDVDFTPRIGDVEV